MKETSSASPKYLILSIFLPAVSDSDLSVLSVLSLLTCLPFCPLLLLFSVSFSPHLSSQHICLFLSLPAACLLLLIYLDFCPPAVSESESCCCAARSFFSIPPLFRPPSFLVSLPIFFSPCFMFTSLNLSRSVCVLSPAAFFRLAL